MWLAWLAFWGYFLGKNPYLAYELFWISLNEELAVSLSKFLLLFYWDDLLTVDYLYELEFLKNLLFIGYDIGRWGLLIFNLIML